MKLSGNAKKMKKIQKNLKTRKQRRKFISF